jgi:hypothetical protein
MAQTPSTDRPAERMDRAWSTWLAAGTFVVGLVAGALLVGLLGQDPPAAPTAGAQPTGGGALPAPIPDPAGTQVNLACLRAINAAQDIAAAVDELGAAAAALDAAALDEVVRRLQPLQERLQQNAAECEAARPDAGGAEGAEPGAGELAPGSPTASPTG